MYRKGLVAKNSFWLLSSEAVGRGIKFALLVYAARVLGSSGFGVFSFAFAFVTLFVLLADLGVGSIVTRDFARDPDKEKQFSGIFTLKLLLAAAAFLVVLVSSFFATADPQVRHIIWLLTGFVLMNNVTDVMFAVFRARQRMRAEALAKVGQVITVSGLGFIMLYLLPSPFSLSVAYFIGGIVMLVIFLSVFAVFLRPVSFSWDPALWKQVLRESWPLGFVALFVGIYNSIDSVMLGFLGLFDQVGWYNAAYRVINLSIVPMVILSQAFYAPLSAAYGKSVQSLGRVLRDYFCLGFLLALPVAAGGIMVAGQLIEFVYGQEFLPAATAFRILLISVFFILLMSPLSHVLIVIGKQRLNFFVTMFGALFNIIINLYFIPRYGMNGAAFTTALTVGLLAVIYFIIVVKNIGIGFLGRHAFRCATGGVVAVTVMTATLLSVQSLHLPVLVSILVSGMVYVGVLFLLRLGWNRFNKVIA
ncbi:MAG: flippase [Patescibacteria group bacterium]|nr:flippase [Patescibacteria group bacterium]